MDTTKASNAQLTISRPSMQLSRWIGEQLAILAEASGESLTTGRMKIYAADLADIGQAQLAIAFRRARRECRFFPKIAELRELAGAGVENVAHADSAWLWLTRYIEIYGVDGETLYRFSHPRPRTTRWQVFGVLDTSEPEQCARGDAARNRELDMRRRLQSGLRKGELKADDFPDSERTPDINLDYTAYTAIPAPPIPPAIEYAVRQLAFDFHGGLERIEAARDDPAAAGWVRKEFVAAYGRALAIGEQALVARLTVGCEAPGIEETKESFSSLRLN